METSRFELDVPDSASADEAAAIAVAIGAHLTDRALATEDEEESESWAGQEWQFASKVEGTRGCSVRIPSNAPTDPWTAAGRLDRM